MLHRLTDLHGYKSSEVFISNSQELKKHELRKLCEDPRLFEWGADDIVILLACLPFACILGGFLTAWPINGALDAQTTSGAIFLYVMACALGVCTLAGILFTGRGVVEYYNDSKVARAKPNVKTVGLDDLRWITLKDAFHDTTSGNRIDKALSYKRLTEELRMHESELGRTLDTIVNEYLQDTRDLAELAKSGEYFNDAEVLSLISKHAEKTAMRIDRMIIIHDEPIRQLALQKQHEEEDRLAALEAAHKASLEFRFNDVIQTAKITLES